MLDLLIKNANVIDGSGVKRYRADIGVIGDRVAEIGCIEGAPAKKVIDAQGWVVTPGFIDMHSHADFTLPICPTADSLIYQGITTAVVGNCGFSMAPLFPETRQEVIQDLGLTDGPLPWEEWTTFESYWDFLQRKGISINAAPLLGHGVTRAGIMGFTAGPASRSQMERMQSEVTHAMSKGAFGVSTGLIYPPGSFSSTEELIEFTRPVGEHSRLYFTHMRDEADLLLPAVTESIRIGRESSAAVQISHFKAAFKQNWDKAAQALELIDRARAEGLDVSADMYPYLAGSTYLKATIPGWAHEGGSQALINRLRSNEERQRITATSKTMGFFRNIAWENVIFATAPRMPECQGRYIVDLAQEAGKSTWDWVFDALLESNLEASILYFMLSEENLKIQLQHPAMMIGTDGDARYLQGSMASGLNHPRSYGTFPRVLGRYVRELRVLSLEDAIHKMTGLPAEKLRLQDRGLLKKGYAADLVVVDPETVADLPTYENPYQMNKGIEAVIVNGKVLLEDGILTHARPGIILAYSSR